VRPYLKSGRLTVLGRAPDFALPAYVVYPGDGDLEFIWSRPRRHPTGERNRKRITVMMSGGLLGDEAVIDSVEFALQSAKGNVEANSDLIRRNVVLLHRFRDRPSLCHLHAFLIAERLRHLPGAPLPFPRLSLSPRFQRS
jgi:hypothetical protein